MRWSLVASLFLLVGVEAAFAKLLCPPGRFALTQTAGVPMSLGTDVLVLGSGRAAIDGACPEVRAGDFVASADSWLLRVRAGWSRCGRRRVTLRARFDTLSASFCARLHGVVRIGRRAVPFVADRVPVCGDRLRQAGEECDEGPDGGPFCGTDCRATPGAAVACDAFFPCPADRICVHICGLGGLCRLRAYVDCSPAPVCGCDGHTRYADPCAAYEAGTGPAVCVP